MDTVLVLQTRGKNDSVDYVKVIMFDTMELANNFIKENNKLTEKYWTAHEIIKFDESIELVAPCDEN